MLLTRKVKLLFFNILQLYYFYSVAILWLSQMNNLKHSRQHTTVLILCVNTYPKHHYTFLQNCYSVFNYIYLNVITLKIQISISIIVLTVLIYAIVCFSIVNCFGMPCGKKTINEINKPTEINGIRFIDFSMTNKG